MKNIINHRWFIPALIAVAMLAWSLWYVWYWEVRAPLLEVHFLDVARGSSVFVRTPHGKTVLIGAGEGGDIISRLTELMPLYQRKIDIVIAPVGGVTNTATDTVPAGIEDVRSRYRIDTYIDHATDAVVLDEWEDEQVVLQPISGMFRLMYGSSSVLLADTLTRAQQVDVSRTASVSIHSDILYVRSAASTRVSHNFFTQVDPKYLVTGKFPAHLKPKPIVATSTKKKVSKKVVQKEEKFDLYTHSQVKTFALGGKGMVTFISDGSSFKTKTTE